MTQVDEMIEKAGMPVTVLGKTKIFKDTPVISTGIYAAGDLIGDKIQLVGAGRQAGATGIIQSLRLSDLDTEDAAIDVIFFDSDPSASTFTDNAAFDIDDDDLVKVIGVVSILATDYVDFVDNSLASKNSIGLAFELNGTADLFAAMVVRGTPTYTSVSDLQLQVGILQD